MRRPSIFYAVLVLIGILLLIGAAVLTGCQPSQKTDGKTTVTQPPKPGKAGTGKETKNITATLYFIKDRDGAMFLVPEERTLTVDASSDVAAAILRELVEGSEQSGLISFIPRETKIFSVIIKDGVAAVDFSRQVLNANVGSSGEAVGIAQIVNTLTELDGIEKVKFLVEGREKGSVGGKEIQDWWGHIGLYEQPFSRRDDLVQGGKVEGATIKVESPTAFSAIGSPFTVKGKAQAFEAQFHVRVLDKDGTVLADVPVMADDYNWGNFNEQIEYEKPKESGHGMVYFYFNSAEDGREIEMGSVTIFFE